jgi:hypothetical protein
MEEYENMTEERDGCESGNRRQCTKLFIPQALVESTTLKSRSQQADKDIGILCNPAARPR